MSHYDDDDEDGDGFTSLSSFYITNVIDNNKCSIMSCVCVYVCCHRTTSWAIDDAHTAHVLLWLHPPKCIRTSHIAAVM